MVSPPCVGGGGVGGTVLATHAKLKVVFVSQKIVEGDFPHDLQLISVVDPCLIMDSIQSFSLFSCIYLSGKSSWYWFRLESSFRSFSRPVLHAAARVVQEMGRSRAAAFAVGLQDLDEGTYVNTFADSDTPDLNETSQSEGNNLLKMPVISMTILY